VRCVRGANRRGGRVALGVAGLGIADLASKQVVHSTGGQASGVNYSTMFDVASVKGAALLACSLLAVALATSFAIRLWRRQLVTGTALVLLAAGFLGNLSDRIITGHVRDWIPIGSTRWNLADIYLIVAIPWLLASTIRWIYRNDQGREVTI
jgi:lipoprotein signal peptidase